jgi:hypothetical protein
MYFKNNLNIGDYIIKDDKEYLVQDITTIAGIVNIILSGEDFLPPENYPEMFNIIIRNSRQFHMSCDGISGTWNKPDALGMAYNEDWEFSEDVKAFFEYNDALIVFTKLRAWALQQVNDGTSPSGYGRPQKMRIPTGILSHKAVLEKNGNFYMVTADGIFYSRSGDLNISALEILPMTQIISGSWIDVDITKPEYIGLYSFKDLILMPYCSKKLSKAAGRDTIRILMIDTNVYYSGGKPHFGFLELENITSFVTWNNRCFYGTYDDDKIYEFNPQKD